MKHRELLDTFITHATMACAWAIGIGCVGEKLAPGSVLTHIPFFWLIVPFVFGSLWISHVTPSRIRLSALLHFVPVGGLLLGYFWTRIYEGGLPALLLFSGAILLAAVLAISLLSPHQD